ncbi:hypothetical protein GGS20DRAFT_325634 [Poronia punctata]|nr:hypothetical protein GGS20DRAFT_325634 [Poronia punctata]
MSPFIGDPLISPKPVVQNNPAAAGDDASISSFERPQPRPPRSPAHAAQTRVRNRRREWLTRHPSYYSSLEHELADPLLYDALIRRFQSPEQREKEGRAKGFGRVLEVDLLRGEARLSNAQRGDDEDHPAEDSMQTARLFASPSSGAGGGAGRACSTPMNREELEVLEAEGLEHRAAPENAEEGRSRWDEFLRRRFVAGGDDDFDYRLVDEDEEYDALERLEQELAWFDNEEPSWIADSDDDHDTVMGEGLSGSVVERRLVGETGVQDF